MKTQKQFKEGFAVIEIMFSICIFAISSIGVFYLSMDMMQKDSKVSLDSQALVYAQEGIEAARNISDRKFLDLVDGIHGLQNNAGVWSFGPPPENIDAVYQRKITISDVYRNDSGDVAADGTILDPAAKKVTSEVLWYENGVVPRTVELSAFLSDYRGDDRITTTCAEFASGTMEQTGTQQSSGPPGDNCYMKLNQQEDAGNVVSYYPGSVGNAHANDVEVDGSYAYLLARKSPELNVVNISDPLHPSKTAELALNGGGTKETFVTKYGNYLYIGVGNTSGGLVIVDVSNPANPVKSKTVNIGGQGYKPAVSGNYLFVPVAGKGTSSLKIYNIADRINPFYVTTIPTDNQVKTVEISGNYAYVGLNNSSGWGAPVNAFAIYDISNLESYYQQKISDGGLGCINISTGNLSYYIPLKPSTSGNYPTYGHSADSVTLTRTSRTSSGYVVVPFTFNNMPVDLHNAELDMDFVDLDLHGDLSSTLLLTEAFNLLDANSNNLASLDGSYPLDDSFHWEYSIPSNYLGQTSLTFKAKLTGMVQLQGNNTITVTNSPEQINNILICGNSQTFPYGTDDGVTNPANIVKVSDLNVGDWINIIKVTGPVAYLGTTKHTGNNTLVAVNINNPASPTIAATLNVGNTVKDIAVYDDHVYAAMDSVHSGLAGINIGNPFAPTVSYIEDSGGKSTGIAANNTHLFVSIDTSNKEMSIIEREQVSVPMVGSYISIAYDTGSVDTLYNYLEWESTLSPGGSVKFQIRTADSISNLQSATWVGPDGTAGSYYQTSRTAITLASGRTGNRYYQFKAFFTSDGLSTPFLESVKVNYKP